MLFLTGTLAWLIWLTAPAATPDRVAAIPVPEATAIRVDGELNDAVWQNVPPITSFRQREPRDNGEPTFQTDARVAYDANALYIAVRAHDPQPQKIVGIRTRRDEYSPSDWLRRYSLCSCILLSWDRSGGCGGRTSRSRRRSNCWRRGRWRT